MAMGKHSRILAPMSSDMEIPDDIENSTPLNSSCTEDDSCQNDITVIEDSPIQTTKHQQKQFPKRKKLTVNSDLDDSDTEPSLTSSSSVTSIPLFSKFKEDPPTSSNSTTSMKPHSMAIFNSHSNANMNNHISNHGDPILQSVVNDLFIDENSEKLAKLIEMFPNDDIAWLQSEIEKSSSSSLENTIQNILMIKSTITTTTTATTPPHPSKPRKRLVQNRKRILISDDESDSACPENTSTPPLLESEPEEDISLLTAFSNSNAQTLEDITGCSPEQANIIISLRPFTNQEDLRTKLNVTKGVSIRILDNYKEIMEGYKDIDYIISRCQAIGNQISETLNSWKNENSHSEFKKDTDDNLTFMSQPACVNLNLKLKDYQLAGIRWLNLLFEKGLNGILADEVK